MEESNGKVGREFKHNGILLTRKRDRGTATVAIQRCARKRRVGSYPKDTEGTTIRVVEPS